MKLYASGWNRHVYDRCVFDIELSNSDVGDQYPYNGLNKEIIETVNEMSVASGAPPALLYRFRLHVEKTMGKNYAALLCFNKEDVMSMFLDMFGNMSIEELCREICSVGDRN